MSRGLGDVYKRQLVQGAIKDPKMREIKISRIALDRNLHSRTKLDRRPELLGDLRQYGETKSRRFLGERRSQGAGRAVIGVSP